MFGWRWRKPRPAPFPGVVSTFVFGPARRKCTMQETVLTTVQKRRIQLKHRLRTAPPDSYLSVSGVPSWEIDDPNIATLEPEADGLAASAFSGAPGIAIVTNVSLVILPDGSIVEKTSQFKLTVNEDGTILSEYVFEDATDK